MYIGCGQTHKKHKMEEKMKKVLITTLALGVTVGLASIASAGTVVNSAHDLRGTITTPDNQICVVCHTPHNAYPPTGTSQKYAPLWNHASTTGNFTMYSSPTGTLNATMAVDIPTTDGTVSRACLSCHDGTIALDSFGGVTNGSTVISGAALLGTDLSNDHPVAFQYTSALATEDGELTDPTTAGSSGLGGTIQDDMLFNNSLECGSCHDVHNTPGVNKFLIKSNAASALCLTCHVK